MKEIFVVNQQAPSSSHASPSPSSLPAAWSGRFSSHEETHALGVALGKHLEGGEIFALVGTLGAGKTCFVQGLAEGCEVSEDAYVRSPTFSLVEHYEGRLPLAHLDLYRLESTDDLEGIGWRDLLDGHTVIAVEWADHLEDYLHADFLRVEIHLLSATEREIVITPYGDPPRWWKAWLEGAEMF
jgi:tRNA threonylcarbamoyladenosine biosynthesis protein TsaE